MKYDNVRPISRKEQEQVFKTFNAINTCSSAPAWSAFEPQPETRETVTVACGRCGTPYTYRARSPVHGLRLYCNQCVRTVATPRSRA